MKKSPKVIIVGGVAGGASCAARLRRMDERASITVYDRGPFVSFANCGLPYHVGGVIPNEASLLLASPQLFHDRFRIEVKVHHEVTAIHRDSKTVTVKNLLTGESFEDSYDSLVLSPGAAPLRPELPGLDLPGVFTVRTIPDTREIRGWIAKQKAKHAVVAGGGFIGLEMAENLRHLGLEVTLVQNGPQVMISMDAEMVAPLHAHLEKHGIQLQLNTPLTGVTQSGSKLLVNGAIETDLVILGLGVRPETSLAKAAGLTLGQRGGISVDAQMRTSDPAILAIGDAVEVHDIVTDTDILLALAGPANRQGRIAADVIAGRASAFRGVQGTAICGLFDLAVAQTGATEKSLKRAGITDYEKVYLHPKHHVGYYPGAQTLHLKLIFSKPDGRILGMQAVGTADVARKVDVVSALIQKDGTVFDLEEAELCYAPQFGAAKDALNYAGFIAANHLRGDLPLSQWSALPADAFLLDVRDDDEFAEGHAEGALNIPLPQLRDRLGELPEDKTLHVYCGVGQRAYYAVRLLLQHGFDARDISGGWITAGMMR
ncbi:MAG: Coenzyme disulfide reductase [Verrucomicrobiota bacterium]|jgi:NADPH-dependent 2,4-dienoyl-CoA reductase/sulfur reductase-like enzyme/rhodanese-related sulfurtransferase